MATAVRFEHLAQPIHIGAVRLKNRMMKNATGFFWDDPSTGGFMNDTYMAYYEQLAKGGLALASSAQQPMQHGPMPGFRVLSEEYLPGWRRWADAVHRHGALAFHQLFHLGGMSPLFSTAPPGVASSSIPKDLSPRPHFEVARAMTVPEIHDVVDLFAQAADRMKRAGLDGTELNGACNHLLNSFLSRAWNTREDEYGPQSIDVVDTGSPDQIGAGMVEVFLKPYLLYWLADRGVEILSEARCDEVTDLGLGVTTSDGTRRTLPADTIITALPLVPNTALHEQFATCAADVRAIGDAREPGLIFHAIRAGAAAGREI